MQRFPTNTSAKAGQDRCATRFNAARLLWPKLITRSPGCWVHHINGITCSHEKNVLDL